MVEITQYLLKELLYYNPITGIVLHKERRVKWFPREPDCRTWNTRNSGNCAGYKSTTLDQKTYKKISLFGKVYMLHRVIWMYSYGDWPKYQIDHVNGDSLDNRLLNLRDVTSAENSRNTKLHKNNKSGVNGVSWCRVMNKWRARIKFKGNEVLLGYFDNISDAKNVLLQEREKLGFHPNHGRSK